MTSPLMVLLATLAADATRCEALKALTLPQTTITSAAWVGPGPFTVMPQPGAPSPPAGQPAAAPPLELPAHCRVQVVSKPSADSHIEMEVWLPANWNGKFQAVGNGGWAGIISYPAMGRALQEGYATASTDTGHKGANALFAIGHPEKLADFGYRAVHEMAVQSKAIISSYYQRAARLSYWNGCSTGGRQGLMSAQRYPDDFDAIIAGAPANYHTHLHAAALSLAASMAKDPSGILPPAKLAVVTKAVLDACDARDGVADRLLTNPRACTFDVATLQCTGAETPTCLTAAQVATVKTVYAPARTSDGRIIFPGKDPGSETAWVGVGGSPVPIVLGSLQIAYGDADWDPRTFDIDRDVKLADEKVGVVTNAINPDLRAFKARGGKLLLYHGWNDGLISAGNTIDYYNSVLQHMGGTQSDWVRLFMAPGMGHCAGGAGPNQANWMSAIERWREAGKAPDRIEAARVVGNRLEMTRPLCPYPEVAHYTGVGSTNDAANFVCKAR